MAKAWAQGYIQALHDIFEFIVKFYKVNEKTYQSFTNNFLEQTLKDHIGTELRELIRKS